MAGRISSWLLKKAWDALGGGERKPARGQHNMQPTSPSGREATPYRTVNRDKAMQATTSPPGARQQWQLHRVREESRDLQLRSPLWGGFIRYVRIQTIGHETAKLMFSRLTNEDKVRLAEVIKWIRREWDTYQMIRDVGGTGQNIHQMAGSVLHHTDVDGDCFMMKRMVGGKTVWDLHPGDALAESSYNIGFGNNTNRQLGIETDDQGKPVAYFFGTGGNLNRLNWGYLSYAATSEIKRVPAKQVQHIRDRSGEITAVRGWPTCTQVVEDIARLDEWYSALIRSAELRASVGIALEREEGYGTPGGMGAGFKDDHNVRSLDQTPFYSGGGPENVGGEPLPNYQEFLARAGSIMQLEPGVEIKEDRHRIANVK